MKIYYIAVLEKIGDSGKTLVAAEELNTFSFFQRKTVREFLKFTSEVVVSRTSVEQRVRVKVGTQGPVTLLVPIFGSDFEKNIKIYLYSYFKNTFLIS